MHRFLTLFGKTGVNKGALRWFTVGDQVPHLCPQSHCHALLRHYYWQMGLGSKIMPREGVGVALGAQVGHLVTYRDPLVGLPKSVKNGAKKGGTPVFDRF